MDPLGSELQDCGGDYRSAASQLRMNCTTSMRQAAVKTDLTVECLWCGHTAIVEEQTLEAHGVEPGAPIASFLKRLVCKECGSHGMKAQRVVRDAGPLSPH